MLAAPPFPNSSVVMPVDTRCSKGVRMAAVDVVTDIFINRAVAEVAQFAAEPSGFASVGAPLMIARMRRANRQDLQKLKAILER